MKNYYVVETDCGRACPEVKATFTNKAEAIKEAKALKKVQTAKNELWNEKHNNRYFVTTSTEWKKEEWYDVVPVDMIVDEA